MGQGSNTFVRLVTDDPDRSRRLKQVLARWFHIQSVPLDTLEQVAIDATPCIVDTDLTNRDAVLRIRSFLSNAPGRGTLHFVIDDKRLADMAQANALGASGVLRRSNLDCEAVSFAKTLNEELLGSIWTDVPDTTRQSLACMNALNDALYTAVGSDRPLPKDQLTESCDSLISNIQEQDGCLSQWLNAVREHHSYTYRHSMIVSGLSTGFATSLGMRRADVERIAVGALLHDVGKMKLPLALLDKPGALTPSERAMINKHPGFGADILRADGQFDEEVIELTLHHHELLDGSGYPDGLKGDQLSDPVRILTIVDIFSAMIDERAYKAAIPCDQAYETMVQMNGKLDRDILRAFEPTAASAGSEIERVHGHVANG